MPPRGPNVGSHMSIAGGLHLALARGAEAGCVSIVMFCKSSSQWRAKPLAEGEIRLREAARLRHVVAHASYLVNLASPDPALLERSRAGFRLEMERCEAIEADYLVFHPGAHMGAGADAGLATLAASLDRLHAECAGFRLKVLLEITAGAGTLLGSRFEELAAVLARVAILGDSASVSTPATSSPPATTFDPRRLVVCMNATRARPRPRPRVARQRLEDALGSHRDRHEHIGRAIGLRIPPDARPGLRDVPKILEPKTTWTASTSPRCDLRKEPRG